ncbi:MAG: hypothetical protein K2F65_04780 [Eubacterium sp.]|nr:hypothetical protein [Eubacterium sp.]
MATYTDNLNLKKPDETDFVDIEDINENMDAIDDAISNLEGKVGSVYCTCGKEVVKGSSEVVMVANSISGNFSLEKGAVVNVKFILQSVSGANIYYLDVDGTGAKSIKAKSTSILASYEYLSGNIVTFIYDGTCWCDQLPYKAEAGKSRPGIVRLSADYTTDASNDSAATTLALNKVYQLADKANNTAKDAIPQSQRGKANGVASLDDNGKIPIKQISFEAFTGYTDTNVLGLYVDYENKIFTRLSGAVGKSAGDDFNKFAMYGGRKRCNVSDNGIITAYYGDSKFKDDGTNGQVMVYQPKFYYKVVPLKMDKIVGGLGYHIRKANYYVTDTPKADFKLHPAFYDENGNEVDYILYSAYEGSMYNAAANNYVNDGVDTETEFDINSDLICSAANQKPISGAYKNLTKTNFELLAQNRGQGWHLETIKSLSANQLLMMIELGTMNVQTAIGKGIVSFQSNPTYNAASLTGSTKELGNAMGYAASTRNEVGGVETAYSEEGKVAVSYRGVENPWGNIYKHINGINIWGDGTMAGGQPYIADDFNFNASKHTDNYKPVGFTLPNGAGYISAMGYGSEKYDWLLIASELSGSNALPVGDYTETTSDVDGYRSLAQGGVYYNNFAAGIFNCYCSALANGKGRTFGGRLIYVPTSE